MSGQKTTQIIGGPALITYRGATFRSKGDITLSEALETFAIETSILGQVDERVREHPIRVTFIPDGEWSNLGVLYPYVYTAFGDLITPVRTLGNIVSNVCNIPSHNLMSGDAVYVDNYGGSITTGLTVGVLYYVHSVSSDAVEFMLDYADAVAGTNPISISNGTGTSKLVVNNPLVIQSQDGIQYTFFNVAVTKMPNIIASTVQTLTKEVTFEAFLVSGLDWSATNSLYSIVSNPWPGDSTFAASNILTGEVTASWGVTYPWDPFNTKTGFEINFAETFTALEVDSVGVISRRLSNLVVTASATPVGVAISDVNAALYLQGTNAGRGRSLGTYGNNLLINASGVGIKLFNAALRGGPGIFSNKLDRVGALTWVATRTLTGGVPNPLFYVSTVAVS